MKRKVAIFHLFLVGFSVPVIISFKNQEKIAIFAGNGKQVTYVTDREYAFLPDSIKGLANSIRHFREEKKFFRFIPHSLMGLANTCVYMHAGWPKIKRRKIPRAERA